MLQCRQKMKERAKKYTTSIKKIFENAISETIVEHKLNIQKAIFYAPKFRNNEKKLYKFRHENCVPNIPKSVDDIIFTGPYSAFTLISCSQQFLLFDTKGEDRIIAFASDVQMVILTDAKRWHLDGTLKAAPTLFFQMYMINACTLCFRPILDGCNRPILDGCLKHSQFCLF